MQRSRFSRYNLFHDPPESYPIRAVAWGTVGMFVMLVVVTTLIELSYHWFEAEEFPPELHGFTATCYWAGDVRYYTRVAIDGYSRYPASYELPHMTELNERSWWPLFPALTALTIETIHPSMCASRTVNGIALVLFVPIFATLTCERRWWRLLMLGWLPFGAWLYLGEANTLFLMMSALLLLVASQGERHPLAAGLAAVIVGFLAGITKPNSLTLIPALGVWVLLMSWDRLRHQRERPAWRVLLESQNPAWAPLLGALAVLCGNVWWIWQSSSYYPYHILLMQRTLWWREFEPGSVPSLLRLIADFTNHVLEDFVTPIHLQRMIELSAMVLSLALAFSRLPPQWEPAERLTIPLHWRVGILSMLALMVSSGQTHGLERYAGSNIFVVLTWYRLVFGEPGERVSWRVWTFPGLMRWSWVMVGLALWMFDISLLLGAALF